MSEPTPEARKLTADLIAGGLIEGYADDHGECPHYSDSFVADCLVCLEEQIEEALEKFAGEREAAAYERAAVLVELHTGHPSAVAAAIRALIPEAARAALSEEGR